MGRRVAQAALRRGLVVLAGQPGLIDGVAGDHLLLAPPYVIEREETEATVEILGAALAEVEAQVR